MSKNIVKMEDGRGNILYPQTKTSAVLSEDGTPLDESIVGKPYFVDGVKKGEIFNDPDNIASGENSQASGYITTASGDYSTASGLETTASGQISRADGGGTIAKGTCSHATGLDTIANDYQMVAGKYNTENKDGLFIVGFGSTTARANALRVSNAGRCYGTAAFGSSGADYAEMWEWMDGNPNNEDRRGLFVTHDGEKVKLAQGADEKIIGIISAYPSVVGDLSSDEWHGKFLKDVFGDYIWEDVEVEEQDLGNGHSIPAHTEKRRVLNPEYDPNQEYTSRDNRKEWATVGVIGKLVVVDDGTCEVNGYCKPSQNGIATASTESTRFWVISRIDETHIKVWSTITTW